MAFDALKLTRKLFEGPDVTSFVRGNFFVLLRLLLFNINAEFMWSISEIASQAIVYFFRGRIVGFMLLSLDRHSAKANTGFLHVHALGVGPKTSPEDAIWKPVVFKKLVENAMRVCFDENITEIVLEALKDIVKVYQAHGFVKHPNQKKTTSDVMRMVLKMPLDGPPKDLSKFVFRRPVTFCKKDALFKVPHGLYYIFTNISNTDLNYCKFADDPDVQVSHAFFEKEVEAKVSIVKYSTSSIERRFAARVFLGLGLDFNTASEMWYQRMKFVQAKRSVALEENVVPFIHECDARKDCKVSNYAPIKRPRTPHESDDIEDITETSKWPKYAAGI